MTPEPDPSVAVLGATALDWVAYVKNMPPLDGIAYADRYIPMPGGTGGNVAAGVRRLGHEVRFLGVLGGDEGGRLLMDAFIEAGVDTQAILIDHGQRSAACFIAVDDHGERLIFSLGGAALYEKPGQLLPGWFTGIKVLFIADAYPQVAIAAINNLDAGARVVFNPGGLMASAGAGSLRPILTHTHVLVVSRQEARAMTGIDDQESAVRELAGRGPEVVMLTLGSLGVLVLEEGNLTSIEAFPVPQVVDTTGAGDAFVSGVITGALEGLTWTEAARLGCAAASIKILHPGARGGQPDRQQVQAVINSMASNSYPKR